MFFCFIVFDFTINRNGRHMTDTFYYEKYNTK